MHWISKADFFCASALARKAEVESVVKMTMSVFATVMMASLIYMEFFPAHRPSLEIYEQVPRAQGAELNESEEPKKDQTREDWKGSVLADL